MPFGCGAREGRGHQAEFPSPSHRGGVPGHAGRGAVITVPHSAFSQTPRTGAIKSSRLTKEVTEE